MCDAAVALVAAGGRPVKPGVSEELVWNVVPEMICTLVAVKRSAAIMLEFDGNEVLTERLPISVDVKLMRKWEMLAYEYEFEDVLSGPMVSALRLCITDVISELCGPVTVMEDDHFCLPLEPSSGVSTFVTVATYVVKMDVMVYWRWLSEVDSGISFPATLVILLSKIGVCCGTLFSGTDLMAYPNSRSGVNSVAAALAAISILSNKAKKSCDILFSSVDVVGCWCLPNMPFSILSIRSMKTEMSCESFCSRVPQVVV